MRIIHEMTSFEPLESKQQVPFVWSGGIYVWKMGFITYRESKIIFKAVTNL